MAISAIIFDLGRVLVNVDITRGIFRLFGLDTSSDMQIALAKMMQESIYYDYNQGKLTPQEFHKAISIKYKIDIEFIEFQKLWCDVFSQMPGMFEMVKSLECNYKLGLLSDTDPMHWNYIKHNFPVVSIFKSPTLSFEIGLNKPHRQTFLTAAEKIDAKPQECIYIDDLQVNVDGAEKIGMDAIRFENCEQVKNELIKRKIKFG